MRNSRKLYNAYKRAMANVQSREDRNNNGEWVTFQYVAHNAHVARMRYMKLDHDGSYFEKNGYRKDPFARPINHNATLVISGKDRGDYTHIVAARSAFGLDRAIQAFLNLEVYTDVEITLVQTHTVFKNVYSVYNIIVK